MATSTRLINYKRSDKKQRIDTMVRSFKEEMQRGCSECGFCFGER